MSIISQEWFIADCKILLVLLGWILATFGYRSLVLRLFYCVNKANPFTFSRSQVTRSNNNSFLAPPPISSLEILVSLVLGVGLLIFIVSVLHFFIPLYGYISLALLLFGIVAFFVCYAYLFKDWRIWISGIIAFLFVGIYSLFLDSISDSINYHIQIVTWIQESNLVFGLGNIHTRLGYNGNIYNFYALTDVSQILASLRSFIGNEIVYFGFLFSAFYGLLCREKHTNANLFLLCCLPFFVYVLYGGELSALYCEGIGAVFGILVFALLLLALEIDSAKKPAVFFIAFFIVLIATTIKIANTALVFGVILGFVYVYRKKIFSREFLRGYVWAFVIGVVFCLPWVLKGLATSGMIAYPASIGYLQFLPFAVSEEDRASEVCWIMSWARDPGKNCVEVLSSNAWLWDWLHMKQNYFHWYFKRFVWTFFCLLGFALVLFGLYYVSRKSHKQALIKNIFDESRIDFNTQNLATNLAQFALIFVAIVSGVGFWFVSGPDPRFGMVYIIPLLGALFGVSLLLSLAIRSKLYRFGALFVLLLCCIPFFLINRPMIVFVSAFWVIFVMSKCSSRVFVGLMIVLSLVSVPNFYRKNYKNITQMPKVLPVHVTQKITDFGVVVYQRTDEPTDTSQTIDYEVRPMTPYFNPRVRKGEFLGRDAYINEKRFDRRESQK
ncbi:Uncharacterised protein [Helicobacter fennelliae]|uniref:DUF8201 domain-containing protein n=1 Tax=Helicobacter fennelliae TaxID=215 RepID=A0A2X3B2D0_9HELI|nr:hypothetical protein [Helicobacter fennelliae]SQB99428.1 Uncharacterised protein [Helicobacter fennelliae]